MSENYYDQRLAADYDLCKPIATMDELGRILLTVAEMVGEGKKPTVSFDLELLQVVDYTAFPDVTEAQRDQIKKLHSSAPVRTDEMVYLALRSMICFDWPPPESVADIERAADYERVLSMVLTDRSIELSRSLTAPDALLPYWGRLGFLTVMRRLPPDKVAEYKLDNVACVLTKKPAFNATTFAWERGPVLGLNFALQPILKNLNRYLLHFFHTKDMAGPSRMMRAWSAIVPTVLYFWAAAPANKLSKDLIFFDQDATLTAQHIVTRQLEFIIMHELGHVVLDHPRRLAALQIRGGDITQARHEFEFGADTFAYGLVRSVLFNRLAYHLRPPDPLDGNGKANLGLFGLSEYEQDYQSICLLFLFMDCIDRAGLLLKGRLGERIKFRAQLDSHPKARDRLARLHAMHLGDLGYTTELIRYAEQFFDRVLSYAEALEESELLEGVLGIVPAAA
jgi:hypothetical protein